MVSASKNEKIVAAIGNFDGVHLGHQYLLAETEKFAAVNSACAGAVVFDPHPRRYFRPDDPPFLITTPERRAALLSDHGVTKIINLPFNKALASLTPSQFVKEVLRDKLNLAGVVAGADFRFGAGRAGAGEDLVGFGAAAGLAVKLVDVLAKSHDTDKFGSSAIRAALREGDIKAATAMLGRNWAVRAIVIDGQKLGRTLGFPTANMMLGDLIEPRNGVYAVMVSVDGQTYRGVANFGRRPTIDGGAPLLEANLFDFDGDLYGKSLEVVFIDFIRDEQKFDGLEALKTQIGKDCETARRILG